MSYSETVRFLYDLQSRGMKFGLEGITKLLDALDNPHRNVPYIHIAGTNGKGSTASMLAAIFTAASYRTGLYTSPHLIDFTERIRINGTPIAKKDVVRYTRMLEKSIGKHQATFFEATTAMAFAYFAEKNVDVAVIETGLGGRLDSTNVIRPLVSVITNIGLEHTDILGDTIEKIAFEKAGIIKKKVPCVTGVENRKAFSILKNVCSERNAPLIDASNFKASANKLSIEGTTTDFTAGKKVFKKLHLSLPGTFQFKNLALALKVVDVVNRLKQFDLSEAAIREGLGNVQEFSGLQGRLSLVENKPPIITDVAHNSDGMQGLAAALKDLKINNVLLVFGAMKDKDYEAMVDFIAPLVSEAITVAPKMERARSASDIAAAFSNRGIAVSAALSVREGVRLAMNRGSQRKPILITGSHFVVGEALETLRKQKSP